MILISSVSSYAAREKHDLNPLPLRIDRARTGIQIAIIINKGYDVRVFVFRLFCPLSFDLREIDHQIQTFHFVLPIICDVQQNVMS